MPVDDLLQKRFLEVDTTAICDADKATRVMDSAIRLRSRTPRICGPAFTVRCGDDLLAVLQAVETAAPGEVIVVDGGGREIALAGELFARGALVRRLGGIIVDAGYRDISYISGCALPVYSRFITPMAGSATKAGELRVPVTCGGVTVMPGDMILADREGIVVVEPDKLEGILDGAAAVKRAEGRLVERLDSGAALSDVLNLQEHVNAVAAGQPSSLRFLV